VVRFPAGTISPLFHSFHIGSRFLPVSLSIGCPGPKMPGLEADHSHPSSVDVKNVWSYTSTPPYVLRCNI
jgi:hypothetical protein